MTEIPVQHRKSGVPWWVWLLAALVIIALLFWLFSDNDRERAAVVPVTPAVAVDSETAVPAPADANAAGPITALATVANAGDLTGLVGREVRLNGVLVDSVVGDRGFWIRSENDGRAFVVLNEQREPGNGVEGRYNVQAGQRVDINGVIRSITDPAFADKPIEGLPAGQQEVIHAQSLNILQRS